MSSEDPGKVQEREDEELERGSDGDEGAGEGAYEEGKGEDEHGDSPGREGASE